MVDDKAMSTDAHILTDLVHAHLKEQRSGRRWKVFFRLLAVAYIGGMSFLMLKDVPSSDGSDEAKHVAVVDVKGEIASDSRQGASAERLIKGLTSAFEADNAVAVMIRINSPGGSPVQSAQVYREIIRLKELHPDRPVYAVAEDIAASGAYYIAAAADQIYADSTSLVGSVGVIMGGFGFTEAMDKLGVERRVYTAGKHKAFMDPYSKEQPETIAHANQILANTHRTFIADVRKGRGDRIKGTDEDLFNGLIWTGSQAVELGLVDGIGSVRELAREKFDTDRIVSYSQSPNPLESLADRISASFASEMVSAVAGGLELR